MIVDEVSEIVRRIGWLPSDRVVFAALWIVSRKGSYAEGWRAIDNMPTAEVANLTGVSERTARATLQRFEAAGLICRRIEQGEVTLLVRHKLSDGLPNLSADDYHAKARARSALVRQKRSGARRAQ